MTIACSSKVFKKKDGLHCINKHSNQIYPNKLKLTASHSSCLVLLFFSTPPPPPPLPNIIWPNAVNELSYSFSQFVNLRFYQNKTKEHNSLLTITETETDRQPETEKKTQSTS